MKALEHVANAAPSILFVFIVASLLSGNSLDTMVKYAILTIVLLMFILPTIGWIVNKVSNPSNMTDD